MSANAYLGGWGIAAALQAGADVVVCPRVTDAALVVGPAAWWWDWALDDWDALAGAVVAGHVIECGAQATGGNYSWFSTIPDLTRPPGFPIAEIAADGSTVITKHPDTGGVVDVGTVTAQLLYEIGAPQYAEPRRRHPLRHDPPDARTAPTACAIGGTRGTPAPPTTKVCINLDGGYRNRMTFVLTGLDQAAKADWVADGAVRAARRARTGSTRSTCASCRRRATPSARRRRRAGCTSRSRARDERLVGRAFSSARDRAGARQLPRLLRHRRHRARRSRSACTGRRWSTTTRSHQVVVHADGSRTSIARRRRPPSRPRSNPPASRPSRPRRRSARRRANRSALHFAARSGDKGGNANVGIWARDAAGYAWLHANLTADALVDCCPRRAGLAIRRYELPNLHALNFVIVGYLGEGVASSTAFDAQAKGLGEYLRSRPWPADRRELGR